MHICFISYWGLNEGLTQATVVPHLRILAERDDVEWVSFISIERKGDVELLEMPKVKHYVLRTSESISSKLFDRPKARKLLDTIYHERPIDRLFARSSLAGWLTLDFVRRHAIPLVVESFEPHADYMLEAGVWKKLDPRYVVAKAGERMLKKVADVLLPVTQRFAQHMVENDGIDPAKLRVMPCCVDAESFAFNPQARIQIRQKLNIHPETIVGVYTGKLGGIYLQDEALQLFASARNYWQDRFFLIVLSPDHESWKPQLAAHGFSASNAHVAYVKMHEVAAYLSSADVAFSLHKPGPSKMGISPIKNAEYFAAGLPVIMPEGIGDDSLEVEKWNLGVTFPIHEIDSQAMFNRVSPLVDERVLSPRIADWAKLKRSFDIVRAHYDAILNG